MSEGGGPCKVNEFANRDQEAGASLNESGTQIEPHLWEFTLGDCS